jgi:4'-phosphopantetheinyl transferase
MMINDWIDLPEKSEIGTGEVQVWVARVDEQAPEEFWRLLSEDERTRADRLHSPQVARRFGVGRGILRVILGSYLGQAPGELVFSYGEQGKPFVKDCLRAGLSFNLAHSAGLVVAVVASGLEVGVDIEQVHPVSELESAAGVFLSPQELEGLSQLPPDEKLGAFFSWWTRKEAALKAFGRGVMSDVILLQDGKTAVLPGAQDCQVDQFSPEPGYAGALATFSGFVF